MRVVYRAVVAGVAVLAVGGGAAFVLLGRSEPASRAAVVASPPGVAAQVPVTSVVPTGDATVSALAGAGATAAGTAVPTAGSSTDSSAGAPTAGASPDGVTASPEISPSADADTAMDAALTDPRVPALPANDRRLRLFHGKPSASRSLVKDKRSGVAFPRFAKSWQLAKASPFASRQVLPKVKGSAYRGLLVSCPVPIPVQGTLRDTAFLAARWTLNHHPSGATLTWTASQPIKVGKRKGWVLGYTVHYTLKGRKHTSAAAVALVEVPDRKPALVFVTIPDGQRKQWRDINKVMSSLHVL
ncbi:hypothetical protein JOL79_22910 [Microbispora sp. RL4-1S]|uniref:Uncharacterized protein n=1 Tax=Microbispora oryzae TaxID=2806554 RepID=A0A941ARU1_9ACTN|nr:hypothetical protein [Microbispora oryzae]MBP2706664.1 hypothetical protein [Microbispora oryzae]